MAQLSEAYGEAWTVPATSLAELLTQSADRHPQKTALICRHQPSNLYTIDTNQIGDVNGANPLRWTYEQLQARSEDLIHGLRRAGLKKGDPVATFLHNGVEYAMILWATMMMGCPFVPLNPRNLLNADEVNHMLKIAGVKAVFVDELRSAEQFDECMADFPVVAKFMVCSDRSACPVEWKLFSDLLEKDHGYTNGVHEFTTYGEEDVIIIAFTSGTTNLPKGCAYKSHLALSLCLNHINNLKLESSSISCSALPNNHILGYRYILDFFVVGGTVCFPGPTFEIASAWKSIYEEKCTDLAAVPTMLHALLEKTRQGSKKLESLRQVALGGAAVTGDHLKQVITELGAQQTMSCYGMTEGATILCPPTSNISSLVRDGNILVGSPLRGVRIRVCEPGTRKLVPRGTPGELHQGGGSSITEYLAGAGLDAFYTDEDGVWFNTGDQVIMYDDGKCTVVGRYKDLIIRGGENVSPSAIESILNKTRGVNAQVVPAPDEIAGEVPIAVVQDIPVGSSIRQMKDLALQFLGPRFVPEEIITLKELGLEDFPKTMSGKIKKTELAKFVKAHRAKQDVIPSPKKHGQLRDQILEIWSRLLGLPVHEINTDSGVNDVADSITVMRVREAVQKQTGQSISVEEMIKHSSIDAQIALLTHRQPSSSDSPASVEVTTREGPPQLEDILHIFDEDSLEDTRKTVQAVIERLGLSWEKDVEDVILAYDLMQVFMKNTRPESWDMRMSYVIKDAIVQDVRKAIETALANHSMLRSIFFGADNHSTTDSKSFHATFRATKRWFDLCITESGAVKSEQELKDFGFHDESFYARFLGPALRVWIMPLGLEDTTSTGLIIHINHAAMDAMYMRLFFEDLDACLTSPSPLSPHTPYKLYADSYLSLRNSPQALAATSWHTNRLSTLPSHARALFPPPRAPTWFLGRSLGWHPPESVPTALTNPNRESLSGGDPYSGCGSRLHVFEVPSIATLRHEHPHLTGPVIFKAALALLNTFYTRHTHALFNHWEACRSSMPFLPASVAERLNIPVSDIAGPTFQLVIDLIEVRPDESVVAFLTRLQEEQNLQIKLAAAPLVHIIRHLSALPQQGTMTCAAIVQQTLIRQRFNWVPGLAADRMASSSASAYKSLRRIQWLSKADVGLVWAVGLGGSEQTNAVLNLIWDDANVAVGEVERMERDFERVLRWVCEAGVEGGEVGGFGACLGGERGWGA